MLNKGNRLKSSNFTHSLVLPFCCFCGTYGLFTLMNNCNILWAFLTSDISSVPLWLVSPHSLVCYMHCWQPWGERDCHIGKIQQIYTRGESIQPTTEIFMCDFPAGHGMTVLCKYCPIIALICVTPVWCVPCFPRYIFCDLNVKCISCITQPVVHCLSHLRCCKFDRCGIRAKGGVRAT